MIFKFLVPLEIGKIYYNGTLNDGVGNVFNNPFQIIREVTIFDFIKQCKELNEDPGIILDNDHFYEVSVD